MSPSAMNVTLRRTALVSPPQHPAHHLLWMSNLDVITADVYLNTVYFYEANHHSHDFFSAEVLKTALAKALALFYPVAGRLHRDQDSARNCINCNGEGVAFVEADCNVAIDYFGDFAAPSPHFKLLVPTFTRSPDTPLLLLQVTTFKCGGAALGVSLHHHLADGRAALHFINTWAEIARGQYSDSVPIIIDRTALKARVPPTPSFCHVEYQPPPALLDENRAQESDDQGVSKETFHLTKQQVLELKARARGQDQVPCSTFVAVAAHVWRCVSMARSLSNEQVSKVYIATDGRAKLHPPLSRGFLGNVLFSATPMAKVGDLVEQPVAFGARVVSSAITRLSGDYLQSAVDYLELQPNLVGLRRGPHTFMSPNLGITSWIGLPLYDADFGWGKPVHMGPAPVGRPYEGHVWVLPNPKDPAAVDVSLVLHTPAMAKFRTALYDL